MTLARGRLSVVEPQMEGLYHALVNAAMLHTAVLAFPDRRVSFSAFPSHQEIVQSTLREHAPEILDRVDWITLSPAKSSSLWTRLFHNEVLLRGILRRGEPVLFTSLSRRQLLQLKRILRRGDMVNVVMHGDLDQIEEPQPSSFWKRAIVLGAAIHPSPHPSERSCRPNSTLCCSATRFATTCRGPSPRSSLNPLS